MENGVETSGVENTWCKIPQFSVFSKELAFFGKKGKNTKNGVENTGVEYPTFLV